MIPSKEVRKAWRSMANHTLYVSALGEYTPDEFLILLDAVDELEKRLEELKEKLYGNSEG